jgi:FixJ family two-component response regulator
MPELSGVDLTALAGAQARHSGDRHFPLAVEAMKFGALDFLPERPLWMASRMGSDADVTV